MKSMADTMPERIIKGNGKSHFNYNIHEIEIEEPDGTPRTVYAYDYVIIKGQLTKAKIIKALEANKLAIQEEIDPVEIESGYTKSKETIKLSNIANKTYAQLDAYIDNKVTDLSSAKAYLKRLSKVVLAMLKYQNIR